MTSILVVEDNAINRRVVTLMLAKLGHKPDFANDGKEAVAAARAKRYDVILMDIQMPEMDGCEATRQIRRFAPDGAWPYIVALTANLMLADKTEYKAAGMDDFVLKPARLPELDGALSRARATLATGRRGT